MFGIKFLSLSVALLSILIYYVLHQGKQGQFLSLLELWQNLHSQNAEIIFENARIWTGNDWAEAMAVAEGRILAVGSSQLVQEHLGKNTLRTDMAGASIVPGFIDSHVHFLLGGLQLGQLDLRGVDKEEEVTRLVQEAVSGASQGAWILAGGWMEGTWGGQLPNTSWLDQVSPNNPVWMTRIDAHMGLANKFALNLVGISNASQDPLGGTIVRDDFGEPTGLLVDAAMAPIMDAIPSPNLGQRRDALQLAAKHALAHGVTAVVDFGMFYPGGPVDQTWDDLQEVYLWADAEGQLPLRVHSVLPLQSWGRLAALVDERGFGASHRLRWGLLKAFADGSVGSHSALMHQPYADQPEQRGLAVADLTWLHEAATSADAAGLQVAVHAIGDAAVDGVLGAFEGMAAKRGPRDRRLRVEHAQHMSPGAVQRMASLDVIASMQPQHLLDDAPYLQLRLGQERVLRSYLMRSLLHNGSCLALGSDWPVAPLDPLGGIKAAAERLPSGWTHPLNDAERLSYMEALEGYTGGAAHASFWESDIGSLSAGRLADFVVLRQPLEEALHLGSRKQVLATYVAGVCAYSA